MTNLTKPQKLIYDMEKFAGGSIATVCGSIIFKGANDGKTINNAVNEIIRLNDALRMKIIEVDGVPYQKVFEYSGKKFETLTFNTKDELDLYAEKYAKETMDFYGKLAEFKIIKLPNFYGILVKLHHIISDAWTFSLIGTQFSKLMLGESIEAYSYLDSVAAEQEYINSKRYEKDKNFYIEQYKKCDEITLLSDKTNISNISDRLDFTIDKDKTLKIQSFAEKHNTSLYALFMTALSVYFNRIKMNIEKFYIGTAVLNRIGQKEQNTMGMYINSIPVLIELENEKNFKENLENVSSSLITMFRHQKFNYGDILQTLRTEYGFQGNMYDVMLSYQNAKIIGAGDFESTWYHPGMQNESLQIHIDDRDNEGILKINYDYQTDKFTENEIQRMHEHIMNLLYDAISNNNKKIYELDMLSEQEKHTLLYEFNDTKADYPKDKCVHQLFEEQVLKTPDKTAVIACDKTLTYDELNKLANKIANGLIEKGIGVGDIVAFALPRNSYLIPTMLGILKSGAAYMPIDPDYPQDRIDYMLEDSKAKLLITNSNIKDYLSFDEHLPVIDISIEDNFCILHTSGSTGKPKLAVLTHKGIINFSNANKRFFDGVDTVVSATIVTFDAFVQDTIVSLLSGKEIILANEEQIYNQKSFEELFENAENVLFFSTPTKLKHYIENSISKKFVNKIKTFIVGGEVFDKELFDLIEQYSDKDCSKYNGYGPTECSMGACYNDL